jgi:hypothetical protein
MREDPVTTEGPSGGGFLAANAGRLAAASAVASAALAVVLPVDEQGANAGRALAVAVPAGLAVFFALWWGALSPTALDLRRRWIADDPKLHREAPLWIGGAATLALVVFTIFTDVDRLPEAFVVAGLVQAAVYIVAGRHLARSLEHRRVDDDEVEAVLRRGGYVWGAPLILVGITVMVGYAPFTGSQAADVFLILPMLVGVGIALLYLGFTVVYGPGEAVEHTFGAVFLSKRES